MKLNIDRNTKLGDIQAAFSEAFAFLRLEFFRNPHEPHQASPKKDMRRMDEPALSADKRHTMAELDFDGSWTVCQLEDIFSREAGLNVQVFRKSGGLWIETSLTDDWTLEQQNREGELLSTVFPVKTFDANN